jgi:peptide/nickel transport system permease protein
MTAYLARRLAMTIPTILIVAFASFILMRLVPGDVILAQIGAQSSGSAQGESSVLDAETVARMKKQLGIEGTVIEQFGRWLRDGSQGDFGDSWLTNKPTLSEFGRRLPITLELGVLALILSSSIGVSVGVISALFQDRFPDYVARVAAIFALSVPNFFLGVLMVIVLSRWFGWTPPMGEHSLFSEPWTNLRQFIVPAFVIAAASTGTVARLTRTALIEVMRQDYIRTARSKGLPERTVVISHAMKNAMIPVLTLMGAQVVAIVGGAVVVEQIFNLRGVGQLTLTALFQRDFVQLQTNVFLFSLAIVVSNLTIDLVYGLLDPRIKYS